MQRKFIVSCFSSILVTALAFFTFIQIALAEEHSAKKEGEHGAAKSEEGKGGHGAETTEGEAAIKLKKMPGGYVHSWITFPTISGKSVFSEEQIQIQPEKGFVSVVVFIASWCERCQRLVESFEKLRNDFKDSPVRIIYVFSHDTIADAQGFSKEHKLQGQSILSNHEILKSFHNPPLPSIYLADRRGWLLQRYLDAEAKDIAETRKLLKMMTAI